MCVYIYGVIYIYISIYIYNYIYAAYATRLTKLAAGYAVVLNPLITDST